MTKHLVYIILVSGLTLWTAPARAQEAPGPRTLVRAWLAAQAERGRDLGRVELREQAQWTVDWPFGVRRIGWVAEVSGGPDADGWHREPISLNANGRRIRLGRWPALEKQRRSMLGPHAEAASRAVIQLHQVIANMRPTGEATAEMIDGVPCWRVEMVPPTRREAIERYTLWFARTEGHLVRSRALIRAPRTDRPFIITTDYTRVEGFDVARRRLMEGTTQTKRRLRTYTLLFKLEAAYTDYRFFRREIR